MTIMARMLIMIYQFIQRSIEEWWLVALVLEGYKVRTESHIVIAVKGKLTKLFPNSLFLTLFPNTDYQEYLKMILLRFFRGFSSNLKTI